MKSRLTDIAGMKYHFPDTKPLAYISDGKAHPWDKERNIHVALKHRPKRSIRTNEDSIEIPESSMMYVLFGGTNYGVGGLPKDEEAATEYIIPGIIKIDDFSSRAADKRLLSQVYAAGAGALGLSSAIAMSDGQSWKSLPTLFLSGLTGGMALGYHIHSRAQSKKAQNIEDFLEAGGEGFTLGDEIIQEEQAKHDLAKDAYVKQALAQRAKNGLFCEYAKAFTDPDTIIRSGVDEDGEDLATQDLSIIGSVLVPQFRPLIDIAEDEFKKFYVSGNHDNLQSVLTTD